MAMSQAAYAAEKAIGHDDTAVTQQDISNPAVDREKFADPSGERMKALVWMGKNKLEVRMYLCSRSSIITFSPDAEMSLIYKTTHGMRSILSASQIPHEISSPPFASSSPRLSKPPIRKEKKLHTHLAQNPSPNPASSSPAT